MTTVSFTGGEGGVQRCCEIVPICERALHIPPPLLHESPPPLWPQILHCICETMLFPITYFPLCLLDSEMGVCEKASTRGGTNKAVCEMERRPRKVEKIRARDAAVKATQVKLWSVSTVNRNNLHLYSISLKTASYHVLHS